MAVATKLIEYVDGLPFYTTDSMLEPSYVTCTKEKLSWALQYEDIAPTNFLAPSSCGSDTHFSNFTQQGPKRLGL